jgi:starch synthase
VIVLVSARVERPTRRTHLPTGATVLVLPPPRLHRAARAALASRPAKRALGKLPRAAALLDELSAYVATPPRAFIRELRREGCGALVVQEYEYTRFDACVLLARLMGIPVFATFQGSNWPWGFVQRIARPRALRRAAGLIIGPRLEVERVQARYGVPDARIARIFNPVDPHAFESTPRAEARRALELPPAARVAVWYGRVERQNKGLDVLVEAWKRLCRERPGADLRLLMVGTGSDAAWLHEQLSHPDVRGVRWRDEYIHDRSILRLHLSAADVFVFPSRHEGFPVAPIEAMACGVPVVAADAPGVPDILEGGEAAGGVVVPRGDPERLAQALGRVLDDPAWARRLGERARERAERCFSLESVGRQLRSFFLDRGLALRGAAAGATHE